MIKYNSDKKVDYQRLVKLFKEVGWYDKTSDLGRLEDMVDNSQIVITAWEDDLMVGFARCTTDYVFNGQINNVVVDSRYRGRGIGRNLIEIILKSSEKVTYILRGDPKNEEFYKSLEFQGTNLTFTYKRKE